MSITALINSRKKKLLYQLRLVRFQLIQKQKTSVCYHFGRDGSTVGPPARSNFDPIYLDVVHMNTCFLQYVDHVRHFHDSPVGIFMTKCGCSL